MKVVVIGAGTMGAGIGQVAATAGHDVTLCDVKPDVLERALTATSASLDKFVAKQKLTADDARAVLDRIGTSPSVGDAAQDADVVIESVIEVVDVKQKVLAEAAGTAPDHAWFGTNTSQLSVTEIGAALGDRSAKLLGVHFFNPPVLMRLVELIRGLNTDDDTVERAVAFAEGLGKETVVCRKDSPGFLTSRISAIVRLECLRMLEEGVASAEDIDKALTLGLNFPMGPLALGDFNGLDTYLHACEGLEASLGERFKPTTTLRNLVAAGRLGRKTGHGIYRYDAEGKRIP